MPETAHYLREDQFPVQPCGEHPLDVLHDGNRGPKLPEHVHVLLVERLPIVFVSVVSGNAEIARPSDHGVGLTRWAAEKHGSSSVFRPDLRDLLSKKDAGLARAQLQTPGLVTSGGPSPGVQLRPVGLLGGRSV